MALHRFAEYITVFVPHMGFLVFRIRLSHALSGNNIVRFFMLAVDARLK